MALEAGHHELFEKCSLFCFMRDEDLADALAAKWSPAAGPGKGRTAAGDCFIITGPDPNEAMGRRAAAWSGASMITRRSEGRRGR